VIVSQQEHTLVAIHTKGQPDILLELKAQRTNFIAALMGVSENQYPSQPRFRIIYAKSLNLIEKFSL
jgi:hypothetical protein